jgi:hypothetical protein
MNLGALSRLIQRNRDPFTTAAPAPAEPAAPSVPPGIEFSALWDEPSDPSMLGVILNGAALLLSFITLLVVIFKH